MKLTIYHGPNSENTPSFAAITEICKHQGIYMEKIADVDRVMQLSRGTLNPDVGYIGVVDGTIIKDYFDLIELLKAIGSVRC